MINSRDYDADAPAEDIGHYGDGGWFPIYIEDLFGDRRYKILNKLGFGGTATVWAARDLRKDTIVSIKVIMAEDSHNNQELRILQHIQQGPCHLGREHLPQLLDYFYEERYGKKNLFLVLELLGPEVSAFTEIAPEFVPSASRLFCKQLLLAIDCLHSYGIIHGDIHPQNILFRLPVGFELPLDDVYQGKVRRKDGAPLEERIPNYVVATPEPPYKEFRARYREFDPFFDTEPPESIHTIRTMTSPELIFRKPLSKGVDIWSLACTTFYFATGRTLFDTWHGERALIPLIHRVVGESSAQWLLTALIEALDRDHGIWKDLSNLNLDNNSDYTILEDDDRINDKTIIPFLRKCLVVDPLKRAKTAELLADKWIGAKEYSRIT